MTERNVAPAAETPDVTRVRTLRYGIVVLLALCAVIFASITMYAIQDSDGTIEDVSGAFMGQMSAQIRLNFDSELRLYRSEMESVALSALSYELRPGEIALDAFKAQAEGRGFTYAAVFDVDGNSERLLGEDLTIDDFDGFAAAVMAGEDRVTVGTTASGEAVVLLGAPAERPMDAGDGTSDLLVMGVPLDEVVRALSLDASTTEVYSHIIREDGSFILNSGGNVADNYLQLLRDSEGVEGVRYDITADELAGVMARGESDFYVVYVNGSRYASCLAPLPETSWFIVSVLPYSVLHDPIDGLVWSLVAVAFAGCLVLMAALAFLFVRYLRVLRQQMGELARARAASEEASRAKSEFLSNMSHDIRTPMNAIVGMTQIARERQGDPVAVSECLDKIAVSSNHLLGLINDVLDMSRIESGRMELAEEPVSLEDVLEGAAAIVGPQAEARGIRFDVEKNLECRTVRTDGTRLSQVLLNLLSNAVKFTPAGGLVTLSVAQGASPRGAGYVRTTLTVSDTGIGMSEEFLGRIFESFEREDSERVRKTEGTGLGMAIVKRIVDGMGGTVEVESAQGAGSTFRVVLDLERCEDDGSREGSVDVADLAGARVLVAEDNDLNWEVVSELLGACGLELEWAQDGRECVERFSASQVGHYDAILMDVRMPGMNGYEATRAIRALDRADAADVPVIAMTADAFAEDRERARACGMNAHVAKPIDLRETLRVIARCLGERRAR